MTPAMLLKYQTDVAAVLDATVLTLLDAFMGDGESSMTYVVTEWRRFIHKRSHLYRRIAWPWRPILTSPHELNMLDYYDWNLN